MSKKNRKKKKPNDAARNKLKATGNHKKSLFKFYKCIFFALGATVLEYKKMYFEDDYYRHKKIIEIVRVYKTDNRYRQLGFKLSQLPRSLQKQPQKKILKFQAMLFKQLRRRINNNKCKKSWKKSVSHFQIKAKKVIKELSHLYRTRLASFQKMSCKQSKKNQMCWKIWPKNKDSGDLNSLIKCFTLPSKTTATSASNLLLNSLAIVLMNVMKSLKSSFRKFSEL